MSINILFVEDDLLYRETIEDFLDNEGLIVSLSKDFDEALDMCFNHKYDIYLLDINLPTQNGISLLSALRDSGDNTPAIFLTSHQDKEKLSLAYSSGADDYIKKPVDLDELLYKIQAVVKRTKQNQRIYTFNNKLYFDFEDKRLFCDNKDCNLAPKASELLVLLILNIGAIVTKDVIINSLWATSQEYSDGAIRVYVNSIKKVLGKNSVQNIRGIGYRLEKNII